MLLRNKMFLINIIVLCVCLVVAQDIPEQNSNEKRDEAHIDTIGSRNESIDASVESINTTGNLQITENNTDHAVNNTLTKTIDLVNLDRENDTATIDGFSILKNNSFDPTNLNSAPVPPEAESTYSRIDFTSTTQASFGTSPTDVTELSNTTIPTGNVDDEDIFNITEDTTAFDESTWTSSESETTTEIDSMIEDTDINITTESIDIDYTIPKIEPLFMWSNNEADIDGTTEGGDVITTTEIIDSIYTTYSETKSTSTWVDSDTTTDIIEDLDINTTTEYVDISSTTDTFDISSTTDLTHEEKLAKGEKKLSENIVAILEHFKQVDPAGVPEYYLPDPCPVDDMRQSISTFDTMYMTDTLVYGTSKLRILNISVDLKNMKAEAAMSVDALQARGQYSIVSWFNPSHGPYTIDVTGMKVLATATLGVEQDGRLQAQDIHMDITIDTMVNHFENLGFVGGMFQNFVNSGGTSFFDSNIPYMLREAYPKMKADINAKLDKFTDDVRFPNSISPLDTVAMEVRNYMRFKKLDPFRITDINMTMGIFTVTLSNTWLTGISSFQRVGNVTLTMENNTVVADFEVGTQTLEGRTQLGLTAGGIISTFASASFSIEYLRLRLIIAQPLDTRKQPVLRDIDFEIGNIQARSNGLGTLDYVIELGVNILPNLLRYQIVNALDVLVEISVQRRLDEINVEEFVKQSLPLIDVLQEFKLSYLDTPVKLLHEKNDEDKFFDF